MEREDLERKRDEVELVADHRNRLADEEQAEVAVTQRREDLQAHSVTSMVTARGLASGGQSRGVSLGASVWGRQSGGVSLGAWRATSAWAGRRRAAGSRRPNAPHTSRPGPGSAATSRPPCH